MATHAGDGSSKEPIEKRIPLKEVCFREPTKIPGISMMLTTLEAGVRKLVDGKDWLPPAIWLDPVRREICIGDRRYPLERVHYYDRSPVAITKTPPPINTDQYFIGKKPVKRG